MATSPRAGVQNVNFVDIYGASRNIHDNNPFAQALTTGADLLAQRDKRIKYERALTPEGEAMPDERTTGEVLGDVAGKAWGGVKSLASTLSNPFMDQQPEAETRTDTGAKTVEMGTPFMSREPGSELPEEQGPQGMSRAPLASPFMESVTFPTTVVGAQDKGAQTLPTPVKRSQGINWSEANRINPRRAEFDYSRAQDVEREALERDKLAQREASAPNLIDDKRATYNAALGQLTSMRSAGIQPDDPVYIRYQNLADTMESELVKAGVIPEQAKQESATQPETAVVNNNEDDASRIERAGNEALAIVNSAVDKNKDGVIDNVVDLRAKLDALSRTYKINTKSPEWAAISSLLDTQERAMKESAGVARSTAEQARAEARMGKAAGQSGGAIDQRAASQKIENLQKNPKDNTLVADATLWYMRKQSGAMIGPTEILQYMQGKLPEDKYKQLVDELSPTGLKAIVGYVAGSNFSDPMITKITAKYTPYIKKDRLIDDLNVYAQKELKTEKRPLKNDVKATSGTTDLGSKWKVKQ